MRHRQHLVLRHSAAHVGKDLIIHNSPLYSLAVWNTLGLSKTALQTAAVYNQSLVHFYQFSQNKRKMSDDAYSSFLDHANQDTGASKSSTQSTLKGVSTKAIDADIPAVIQSIKVDYTSETDEPFEPVSLSYGGKHLPSESSWHPETFDYYVKSCVLETDTTQMNLGNWSATKATCLQWIPRNLTRTSSIRKCYRQPKMQEMEN